MRILGISTQHDSGAAIIEDGKILSAVNEERLVREKLYWGVPKLSIVEALKLAGNMKPSDIDAVALANLTSGSPIVTYDDIWKDPISRIVQYIPEYKATRWLLSTSLGAAIARFGAMNLLPSFKKPFKDCSDYLKSLGINAPQENIEHHDSHGYSAYFTSGWDECLVITLDAVGDGYCSKVFIGRGGKLENIHKIFFFHSPGYYYGYVTHLCGFKPGFHEGKITGLAAFGNPEKTLRIFQKEISYDSKSMSFKNNGGYCWPEITKLKKLLSGFSKEDIAAGIQAHLENLVTSYVKDALALTGIKKVALAGGIFANVKLNQRILEIPGIEGIWVFPHMGDGGLAAGAAFALWSKKNRKSAQKPHPSVISDAYFGPEYSDSEIQNAIKADGACKATRLENIEIEVARLLAQKKVIARFNGRMEYGPRALGNRSILYAATDPSINDWLNKRLKRTEFMPFAPVILEEDASLYFKNYDKKSNYISDFMIITYDVTQRCKQEAPAIVHIDGTARPQVVKPGVNPSYEKILREYKKVSGLSILINTSFNMHEEPIVCSPYDAIRAFKLGHLDYLAIGNWLLELPN